MELYQLRSFVVIAEEANLTRASERLHTSQSAVSTQLRALEEELGVALFTRSAKGMLLTDPGKRLLDKANAAIRATEALAMEALSLRDGLAGAVTIGQNTSPTCLRIPALHGALAQRFPRLELRFLESLSHRTPELLRQRELDAGFFYGALDATDLRVLPLSRLRLVITAPVAWRDRVQGLSFEELCRLPWVSTPDFCPFYAAGRKAFQRHGISPVSAGVTNNEETLRALVAEGVGLAFLRESEATAMAAAGQAEICPGETASVSLNFACLASREDEPIMAGLLGVVRELWRGEVA